MNFPLMVFAGSLGLLMLATWVGDALRRRSGPSPGEKRSDAGLLMSAILTLLFLLVGFTFSMAINRYDLRKNCEQAEAVAIGTLYSRADLLAPADTVKVQALLKRYLDQRVAVYSARDYARGADLNTESARVLSEIWSIVRPGIAAVPAPLMGLLVGGVNDVVNSHRASQAAWLNRIPLAAWVLIAIIAIGSCWLIGFRGRATDWLAFSVVPIAVSVSLFLMSDLDSPRGGVIRVAPQNLASLSQSLTAR
jgi:hypothetical protein